jgi:hypothetical protein
MKRFSKQQMIVGGLGAAGLLTLIVLLFMHASDLDDANPRRTKSSSTGLAQSNGSPGTQRLPSGIERSLAVDIPLIGRMRGTRWIPGHKFQALKAEDFPTGELADRALDVLVDDDGNFVAARFNGERFATKPPEESFKNLLRHVHHFAVKSPENSQPVTPSVEKVSPARLQWDDPSLGDSIQIMMNRSFQQWHHKNALSRFEEIYFALEVSFAGEQSPRLIMVRRYTEGLTDGGAPFPKDIVPWDVGNAIRNSNRYGATVVSWACEIGTDVNSKYWKALMCLTEPWAALCPWPEDKLDPYYGDNRLDEFLMPAEMGPSFMENIFRWSPHEKSPADFQRERAEKNKTARLELEAGSSSRR